MIISKEYGPQFDYKDGTIGKLQLVKRFVVENDKGDQVTSRQGRYTYATKEECESAITSIKESNTPETIERYMGKGLRAGERWCYPGHFDPVGSCDRENLAIFTGRNQ